MLNFNSQIVQPLQLSVILSRGAVLLSNYFTRNQRSCYFPQNGKFSLATSGKSTSGEFPGKVRFRVPSIPIDKSYHMNISGYLLQ